MTDIIEERTCVCTACRVDKPESEFRRYGPNHPAYAGRRLGAICKVCYRLPVIKTCRKCKRETECARGRSVCFECDRQSTRDWRAANPERSRAAVKRWKLQRRYGITPEEHAAMVASREGKCDICGNVPVGQRKEDSVLHVDHDHATGRVRGMLCPPCNKALGWFEANYDNARRYLDG